VTHTGLLKGASLLAQHPESGMNMTVLSSPGKLININFTITLAFRF
jgi:hypothetical protein